MSIEDEVLRLSREERLRLIEVLWDSLTDDAPLEVSEDVRGELDQRLAENRRDPSTALSWDEVLRRAVGERAVESTNEKTPAQR